jgi:hypothetical protein
MLTVNIKSMKSEKKIGRPQGRKGRPLQLYATDEFIGALDNWRRDQPDLPNRSEAIRRLVEQALPRKPQKR